MKYKFLMFLATAMFFVFSGMAGAIDDPGTVDTLKIGYAEVHAGEQAVVPIYFYNDEALGAVQVPLRWLSSDITLDSVSFVDGRVNYLDSKPAGLQESDHQKVFFGAIVFFEPYIAPGNGLLARLYFDVPLGAALQVVMPDTTIFGAAEAELLFFDPTGSISIPPVLVRERPGIIYVSGSDADNGDPAIPSINSMSQNYPNPFNPTTTIKYSLAKSGQVSISVFNILGQKVKSLVNESRPAGENTTVWDGKDSSGSEVASGVYFYRIHSESLDETRKMILMR